MTLLGEAGLRRLPGSITPMRSRWPPSSPRFAAWKSSRRPSSTSSTIRVDADAQNTIDALAKKGVMGGVPVSRLEPEHRNLRDLIIVASTEINTDEDRATYVQALQEVL